MAHRIRFLALESLRFTGATLGTAWLAMTVALLVGQLVHAHGSDASFSTIADAAVILALFVPVYCAAFVVVMVGVVQLGVRLGIAPLLIRIVACAFFVVLAGAVMVGVMLATYVPLGDAGVTAGLAGAVWYGVRATRQGSFEPN